MSILLVYKTFSSHTDFSVRGAIAMDKGIKCKVSDPERANEYFEQGKKHYLIASELLPNDEEYRLRKLALRHLCDLR